MKEDCPITIEALRGPKQEAKGVGTPLEIAKAAEILGAYLRSHPKSDRLDVAALRGLCWLAQSRPEDAQKGFDAVELALGLRDAEPACSKWLQTDLFDSKGRPAPNPEAVADRVREQWKRMQTLWETLEEGVGQKFALEGSSWMPKPERDIGGGSGKTTRYRLALHPIEQSAAPTPAGMPPAASPPSLTVNYICEEVSDAGWLARQFSKGWGEKRSMKHWTVWGVLSLLVLEMIFLAICLMAFAFDWSKTGPGMVKIALSFVVSAVGFWHPFGPLFLIADRRIIRAPSWLSGPREDRLLELRSKKDGAGGGVKLARYAGVCPLCNDGSRVVAGGGGWLYLGRLEGSCEAAPQEHCFTFDHKLRVGVRKP